MPSSDRAINPRKALKVNKEKLNNISHLYVSHFEVNNRDAVLKQLSDIFNTYLKHAENVVLEGSKFPIIKLTESSQGSVGVGVAVS